MESTWPHSLQFLLFFSLLFSMAFSKSVIEPCNSSTSCNSLLSYLLPSDMKLAEISTKFNINPIELVGSNNLDQQTSQTLILSAKTTIKIPIQCPCINGIRQSVSTLYTVQPIDTIESICTGFGNLVSPDQIKAANDLDNSSSSLESGQSLKIPLPCTCFNNTDNGVTALYLSYVVREGDSLDSIAGAYGTTVTDLVGVNKLGSPSIDPGDILAIPISACSSANMNLYNDSLLVPNGGYALTAGNCIFCSCGPRNLSLHCVPSALSASCPNLQCKGNNLFIGDVEEELMGTGCNVTTCLYRGYVNHKVLSSLSNTYRAQCTSNHSNPLSPSLPPSSIGIPSVHVLPSLAPAAAAPFAGHGFGSGPTAVQIASSATVSTRTSNSAPFILVFLLALMLVFIPFDPNVYS
ncbi:hypothetical protein AMTR_s00005p00269380 [Amborella trichopoda]|uniref:LysM domain-containing protein n=2 Tax=Amborella trichopoda TaxID=13333 RepID=W1PG82_AMBTC|nr:hypothetical protein AMTR_s00005p00269380 [Amborella trichopoda]